MSDHQGPAPTAAQFHPGTDVYSQDGQHVGTLLSTVVDETSLELQAVVVRETKRFAGTLLAPGTALMSDELLVPAGMVGRQERGRIELALSADQLRRLPPYLTYQRRYPGAAAYIQGVEMALGGMPGAVPDTEEAHKPANAIEIYPDEPVMLGHTGRRIGKVTEALFDSSQFVGIVLRPEGWFKDPVIMPRRFLERGDDAALFVELTDEELAELQPFQPRD